MGSGTHPVWPGGAPGVGRGGDAAREASPPFYVSVTPKWGCRL